MTNHETARAVDLAPGLTRDYLVWHQVCPQGYADDGALQLAATTDARLEDAVQDLSIAYNAAVRVTTVESRELELMIERLTTNAERLVELTRAADDDALVSDVRDLASQPPVIRFVNLLARDAYEAGASDIHIEAGRAGLAVRYRIDGMLVPAPEPPFELRHAVVSRIKLLAELDIAERRRPQDGRIRVRLEDRELDMRVSTVPTMHGESVVIRLLDRGGRPIELEELGLSRTLLGELQSVARRPHGMVLVTGPTGSGKTTTLYAALGCRSPETEKIITIEDPIEYQLSGVAQMPVHREAGVSFASALRSILRQDPDVVLVGEMRDPETADVAVQAAMTGHLLLSTLHTNDALGAIPRLVDLGVPEFLIGATVEGVLAQRLVRKVCSNCATEDEADPALVAQLSGKPVHRVRLTRGVGCRTCRGTGFSGRTGIFEFLRMTEELREAIARRASMAQLREVAAQAGFAPMRQDAWAKVERGVTTVEEVLRVTSH